MAYSKLNQSSPWVTHLQSKRYFKNNQSIVFSLRAPEKVKSFSSAWLDIRVANGDKTTGIGITITSDELNWLGHYMLQALTADFKDQFYIENEVKENRTISFGHHNKNDYEYVKCSIKPHKNLKTYCICFPRNELENILMEIRNYRRVFRFSNIRQTKEMGDTPIIFFMFSAASNHPIFTLANPPISLPAFLERIAKSDILLQRFNKALTLIGHPGNLKSDDLLNMDISDTTWKICDALRAYDTTMGVTKNEVTLTKHSNFLFTNVQLK